MRLAARIVAPPVAPPVGRCDELPRLAVFPQAYDVVVTRIGEGDHGSRFFWRRYSAQPNARVRAQNTAARIRDSIRRRARRSGLDSGPGWPRQGTTGPDG